MTNHYFQSISLSVVCACIVTVFNPHSYAQASSTQQKHTLTENTTDAKKKAENSFVRLYQEVEAFDLKEYPKVNHNSIDDTDLSFYDDSDQAVKRRLIFWRNIASKADLIDHRNLSRETIINLQIFKYQINNLINNAQYDSHLIPFNSDSQFWAGSAGAAESARCKTAQQCQILIKQFAHIETSFNSKINLMKLGISKGMTLPQVVIKGRDASIAKHVVANAEQSVFFNAFKNLPASIQPEQQIEIQVKAKKVIAEKVIPAYSKLLDFIQKEYTPQARLSIAAHDLPNGKNYYRSQILEYTTLDLSPDEIHEIGLKEVARIRSDMQKIISGLNFKGSFPDFLHFLRTDPQFYAKTPRELLLEAAYFSKRADAMLPHFFARLPKKAYGVAPVPDDIAPTYTTGRYAGNANPNLPAFYWVNTPLLNQRPLWALPALTLHEAVPGHHLQIALASEQSEQPPFRSKAYISAFGEGWALYAEHLGVEMGFYETPYQHFGRLVYEMWRASRLVVDTGMHAKSWSRDQALAFMRENTALSEHEITTEIDRYISWPAQALSYKLGEIKIREIRKQAQEQLGENFDIRQFHTSLLNLGSVPLSILESEMKIWTDFHSSKYQVKSITKAK